MADTQRADDSTTRRNVVYIVIDDMGFASTGAYGNDIIRTPNIDRLAREGVRLNNFHTTAICSATRASLLTGANHHKVGVASVVDFRSSNSNALGHINHAYATTAEILKDSGYATFALGKWHLSYDFSPAGPYDEWPLGRGFDRYYGVLAAMGDQFHPNLTQDNTFISQPRTSEEGYHLSEDLVDHAIEYTHAQIQCHPEKPFFLYLAFGAMHTPFQAPRAYIEHYRGAFHAGWDVLRKRWFENQRRSGVIPADAELSARNEFVPAWDELSPDEQLLAERYMEAYAGFLEHTDAQIGRLTEYLSAAGHLDDTIIVLLSDNGASGEGGRNGRFNSLHYGRGTHDFARDDEEISYALQHVDEIGGEHSYAHYPSGWANALNAPFPWYKVTAFEGGVRDDLIVRAPGIIADPGSVRQQYAHVSDVTPTVLDLLGLQKPSSVKGVSQEPFTGISFAYALVDPNAADRKNVQYYEVVGNRSIYANGWKAVANHLTGDGDYTHDRWSLYHVAEDFSEAHDIVGDYPGKLRELQDTFLIEASKNNVFPMIPGPGPAPAGEWTTTEEAALKAHALSHPARTYRHVILPLRLADQVSLDHTHAGSVDLDEASHSVTIRTALGEGDEGILLSHGDRFGGFVLYVKGGRLIYTYNANRLAYYTAATNEPVTQGAVELGYQFDFHGKDDADVTLLVNGKDAGSVHVAKTYDLIGWPTELKANYYTSIDPGYETPFVFPNCLDEVILRQNGDGKPEGRGLEDTFRKD